MNRKLIRPNLIDPKSKEHASSHEKSEDGAMPARRGFIKPNAQRPPAASPDGNSADSNAAKSKRNPPPTETNAEVFYYKKQIDSRTPMIVVLQDGEQIEGTIEWYDRQALKINRKSEPNILLLKHNIKYMFKAEDRKF